LRTSSLVHRALPAKDHRINYLRQALVLPRDFGINALMAA
jgi:hypothetical protein